MPIRVINVRGMIRPEHRACVCYVGRTFAGWDGHDLGNPFRPHPGFDAVQKYREWLLSRPTIDADLESLWAESERGNKPLGCWCVNATAGDGQKTVCHAQVLAEFLQSRFQPDRHQSISG